MVGVDKDSLLNMINNFNEIYRTVHRKGDISLEAVYDERDINIKVQLYKYLGNNKFKKLYIECFEINTFYHLKNSGIAYITLTRALQTHIGMED